MEKHFKIKHQLFLIMYFFIWIFWILVFRVFNDSINIEHNTLVWASYIVDFIFLSLLIWFYQKPLIKGMKNFKTDVKNNFKTIINISIILIVVQTILYILMILLPQLIANKPTGGLGGNQDSINNNLNNNFWLMSFFLIVYAPIVEEIIYRYIPNNLFKKYNWVFVMIVSSIVFGYGHVIFDVASGDFRFWLLYSISGVAFYLWYKRTNNIIVSIFIHFLINFGSIILFYFDSWLL